VFAVLLFANAAFADITLTDKGSATSHLKKQPLDRSGSKAANDAKRAAKHARHGHSGLMPISQSFHPIALSTGAISLIDAGGLKYFINTDVTFTTSSSASGAASEASYTHQIAASTSAAAR